MKIVLWRLGSLEYKIFPTATAIQKLKDMLEGMDNEKQNHIVWGKVKK